MNTLESLEAYLEFQRYSAAWQQAETQGTRGALGAADALGPADPSAQPDEWVPDQGSPRVPLYTSHERFRVSPDGTVAEQRASGQLLLFRTGVDGSVTLLDEESGAEVVFTSREGNLVDVAQGGVTTTFEVVAPQGSGPLVVERQEADASETVFTEGADHSLTQALAGGGTDTWYDDGTRVRTSGGVTERFDADGTELSETDASGVTTYFRGDGTAEVRVWEDANGQVVRELTLANGLEGAEGRHGCGPGGVASGRDLGHEADGPDLAGHRCGRRDLHVLRGRQRQRVPRGRQEHVLRGERTGPGGPGHHDGVAGPGRGGGDAPGGRQPLGAGRGGAVPVHDLGAAGGWGNPVLGEPGQRSDPQPVLGPAGRDGDGQRRGGPAERGREPHPDPAGRFHGVGGAVGAR